MTLSGSAVVLINVSLGSPFPEAAELLMPATIARLHVKTVANVPLEGVYENKVLLQIAGGDRLLVKVGVGLTTTTTFCVFEQPLADNV